MSVDISQLTARLDPERREAVKSQYEERATNPTAAFLLCFFLGSAGAHRFYLREWRVAFAHLALFLIGAAALIAGLLQTIPLTTKLATHPLGFALDVAGLALLLAALIWEIFDLGRIDHQVYQRNLLLAEGIIAGNLLADQSVVEGARRKLEAISAQAHEQAQHTAMPVAAAGVGAAGIITADEVADARALAEQTGGYSSISYTEVSHLDVSEDPDQARQASAEAAREGDWTETATVTEPVTAAPDAAPDAAPTTMSESITRTHTEDGPRVTDSYEVDRVAGPSAAEVAGLGAAALGAGMLGVDALSAEHAAPISSFDEATQPDVAANIEPASFAAPEALTTEPAYTSYRGDTYGFDDDDIGDVTDASMPAVVAPAADIAVANASPAYVQLADEQDERVTESEQTSAYGYSEPEEAVAPLYLIPEEPATEVYPYAPESTYGAPAYDTPAASDTPAAYDTPAYDEPMSAEPPADAYAPPVASVFSAPAEEPASYTPSWDQSAYAQPEPTPPTPEPAPEPTSEPANQQDMLAELAGFAGLAGAGALGAEALGSYHTAESDAQPEPTPADAAPAPEPEPAVAAEPAPEPVAAAEPALEPVIAAPQPPKMKKIRVRRKVVVDGQVVAEEVVEREVPADMDTAEAAAQIQAELSHATPEQIARLANLSPDEEVQVRQRTEGPDSKN